MVRFYKAICLVAVIFMFTLNVFCLNDDATLKWLEESHNYGMSGYPRFATLADGTILITADNGRISYSTDNGKSWIKIATPLTENAASGVTSASGEYHKLIRANFQPYALDDGRVFLGYRSHTNTDNYTKGEEFYTSIRLMVSHDGGRTFDGEKVLIEQTTTDGTYGFWEPFFMQIDEDTIACYYSDDLNVKSKKHSQQRICYLTYSISRDEWSTEPAVAIYRSGKTTRDGMPMATKLSDGSFAMVVEAQDFARWVNIKYHCVFVVGLSLSKDGRTWSDPVPIYAPAKLNSGHVCAAPSITTLPDGRVVITCQSETDSNNQVGAVGEYSRVFNAIISNGVITSDTVFTPVKGALAANGFTKLDGVFKSVENGYQIWNVACCNGNYLLLAGTAGHTKSDGSRAGANIALRRAEVFAKAADAEAFYAARALSAGHAFTAVYANENDGRVAFAIPVVLKGASPMVYRLDGDKTLLMDISVKNGVISFKDGGGFYAVTSACLNGNGDADKNGKVDIMDALAIAKKQIANIDASDVNGDGNVDLNDAFRIIKGKF